MTASILTYLFFLHFVADFLLQSREMGKKKSEVPLILAQHMGIQFSVVSLGLAPFVGFDKAIVLSLFNTAIHGAIDWNIWRGYKLLIYKKLKKIADNDPRTTLEAQIHYFKYWEDHWFYATIGLDQFLHMATLTLLAGAIL